MKEAECKTLLVGHIPLRRPNDMYDLLLMSSTITYDTILEYGMMEHHHYFHAS